MAIGWEYLAGFFDGEGSISLPMAKGSSLNLNIVQSGQAGIDVLREIQEFLRERGIGSRIDRPTIIDNRKDVYRLFLGANRARAFLRNVYPFLHVKKVQAQDVLRYFTLYPGMTVSPLCRAYRGEVSGRARGQKKVSGYL